MASIRREFLVRARPEQVWAALKDFGAVDRVLARGFVSTCTLDDDGQVRTLTFVNGMTVRERLVAMDDAQMRLAYTAEGGRSTHHSASAQVVPAAEGSLFIWITDFLPHGLSPAIGEMMDAGAKAMKATLEGQAG